MQNRRNILLLMLIIILVVIASVIILQVQNSTLTLSGDVENRASCLVDDRGNCLVMPAVNGLDINIQELNFPTQFEADYHLLVMPFDRDQQLVAITWLPLFEELVAENEKVQLWSIAALPELNPGVRLMVLGGISAGITDARMRRQVTALFLEEQELFLEALAIENTDNIQIFILDKDGIVYYRDTGEFSTEKGQALTEALEQLLN